MGSRFSPGATTLVCASAAVLSLAGCGGGGDAPDSAVSQAQAAPEDERQQALAAGNPPAVGAIALASSNAAGVARGGSLCAISADGSIVAFTSPSSGLVAGDTNGITDLFVKNLRTGAIVRANTTSTGAQMSSVPFCNAMTADGRSVVFNVDSGASLISRDGTSVALTSNATNLVTPAPPANVFQVYVKTIAAAVPSAL